MAHPAEPGEEPETGALRGDRKPLIVHRRRGRLWRLPAWRRSAGVVPVRTLSVRRPARAPLCAGPPRVHQREYGRVHPAPTTSRETGLFQAFLALPCPRLGAPFMPRSTTHNREVWSFESSRSYSSCAAECGSSRSLQRVGRPSTLSCGVVRAFEVQSESGSGAACLIDPFNGPPRIHIGAHTRRSAA
jgi:hypothetical protein